jgi:hypothetical protein
MAGLKSSLNYTQFDGLERAVYSNPMFYPHTEGNFME